MDGFCTLLRTTIAGLKGTGSKSMICLVSFPMQRTIFTISQVHEFRLRVVNFELWVSLCHSFQVQDRLRLSVGGQQGGL